MELDTSGIPAHWLERVRRDAPALLRRPEHGGVPVHYAPGASAPGPRGTRQGAPFRSSIAPPTRPPQPRATLPRTGQPRRPIDAAPRHGPAPSRPRPQPPSALPPQPVRPPQVAPQTAPARPGTPARPAHVPGAALEVKSGQFPPSHAPRQAPVPPTPLRAAVVAPARTPDDRASLAPAPKQPPRAPARFTPATQPAAPAAAGGRAHAQPPSFSDRNANAGRPEPLEELYSPVDLEAAEEPPEQASTGSGQSPNLVVVSEDQWPELPDEPIPAPAEWTNRLQHWERSRRLDSEQRGDRRWSA
jgi:hypothetical protein